MSDIMPGLKAPIIESRRHGLAEIRQRSLDLAKRWPDRDCWGLVEWERYYLLELLREKDAEIERLNRELTALRAESELLRVALQASSSPPDPPAEPPPEPAAGDPPAGSPSPVPRPSSPPSLTERVAGYRSQGSGV